MYIIALYMDIATENYFFSWTLGGSEVYLAHAYYDWEKIKMTYDEIRGFYIHLKMPRHICHISSKQSEYKFIVDGKWCHDPNKPDIDDGFGGKNNVMSRYNHVSEEFNTATYMHLFH